MLMLRCNKQIVVIVTEKGQTQGWHSIYSSQMKLYSAMELGQHLLKQWPGAWRHPGITWTNIDYDIHPRANSLKMVSTSILDMSLIAAIYN